MLLKGSQEKSCSLSKGTSLGHAQTWAFSLGFPQGHLKPALDQELGPKLCGHETWRTGKPHKKASNITIHSVSDTTFLPQPLCFHFLAGELMWISAKEWFWPLLGCIRYLSWVFGLLGLSAMPNKISSIGEWERKMEQSPQETKVR